jgi:dephospho-CoA kinase
MVKIALTGGIATGKSYVGRRLRDAGVPLVDADVLAREVVAAGTPGLAAVVDRFGRDMLTAEGVLDRAKLGDLVFHDTAARKDLEAIVHPAVRDAIGAFFERLPESTPFAVADVPLLYETGRERDFDSVVVAACQPETQIARLMHRNLLSREDAERRLRAQWPIHEKIRRADFVIHTDGPYAETDRQVDTMLSHLRQVRLRQP